MAARLHNGPKSWLTTIQKNINTLLAQWNIDGTLGYYAFGGFLTGFILKKLGNLVTLTLALLIVLALLSSHFGIITINLAKLQTLIGIPLPYSLDVGMKQFAQWSRTHTLELIIALIGAWFGYNIG
jgi:uncharacterized membrane protein (Fun14 family)